MISHRSAHTYLETNIKTASPLRLVVMLYEGALQHIERALTALEEDHRQLDVVNNAVARAQDIITELLVSLDMEKGESIAKDLFRLYMYFNRLLSESNIKKDPEGLTNVRKMMIDLIDAWKHIADHPPSLSHPRGDLGGINLAG